MGLTKRQEQMVAEIIVEESRAAHRSQQERHVILEGLDDEDMDLNEAHKTELSPAMRGSIQDLVETFVSQVGLYEGLGFDGEERAERAASYLRRLIENDVKETVDMLESGDFDGMDEDALLPMHPRHSGHAGGIEGGSGDVEVGAPEKHAPMGKEPPRGYPGPGGEDPSLPPMHPRARH